jgi:excisionase family DNA binding protein
MTVKRTYTIAEAAELTGLSRKAVARRIERGSLRSLVRNGRRLVPRSELVRAGLVPDEGAAPESAGSAPSPVPGAGENASPEVMLASLMRELLDRLERQGNELANYRAITAQAESLHLEREVGELRARLLALEGLNAGGPPPPAARPEETIRLAPTPPAQPPYAQPPASPAGAEQHPGHPIWLPPTATHPSAPQPAQAPAQQQHQPVYAASRPSLAGRLFLFALEAGFIVAVAIAAWLADLEPALIAGSVGAAWLLVALLELIRWTARSRR